MTASVIGSIGLLLALAVLIIGAPSAPRRKVRHQAQQVEDVCSPELYWE